MEIFLQGYCISSNKRPRRGAYFKVRGNILMKFENFVVFSSPKNNK